MIVLEVLKKRKNDALSPVKMKHDLVAGRKIQCSIIQDRLRFFACHKKHKYSCRNS